ncbi:PfkB family carbohydrate kinase [Symplocastrum sp. BBK-W-15]|uniref:PfkB family carbohydrate kinase n=1 Tax=Limnofasciculus baicalensis BBK-W-15 TaxID=2699891 RepID=A0AAE3GV78_9CYAN|nr:PfkB family carbohydrate kinase [Limnofasciculus baicalensis]MCP2730974.1 PfkB family carbohydrate kinase [Limnofasciculus baicalensis BBK-W-15]
MDSYRPLSYPVEAVDTTAAGDTFNGALAVALSEGKGLDEAIAFANQAASVTVTRLLVKKNQQGHGNINISATTLIINVAVPLLNRNGLVASSLVR